MWNSPIVSGVYTLILLRVPVKNEFPKFLEETAENTLDVELLYIFFSFALVGLEVNIKKGLHEKSFVVDF